MVWSFNEMNIAREKDDSYWIYGYTEVNIKEQTGNGPITIQNPISNLGILGYNSIPMAHYVTRNEFDQIGYQ